MTPEESPGQHDEPGTADTAHTAQNPVEAVDEAVAGLDGLDDLPLNEHVERFDSVHTALTVALASIDKV